MSIPRLLFAALLGLSAGCLAAAPELPRVLVIGDSISMNYHDAAKAALAGVADYYRNEGNAGTSENGVGNAETWLGDYRQPGRHWDVIQFNHGLHDLKQAYDAWRQQNDVPFYQEEERRALGEAVAATICKALEEPAKQLPLPGETFTVAGRPAFLILPGKRDAAHPIPWVWYAPTLPNLPAAEEQWMFGKFLAAGIAVAGIDVGESMGNPQGRAWFTALHRELVANRGMAPRPCLLARSRGGLMLYNWAAENPQSVAAIAGVYPVTNLASWPGLAKAAPAFGVTEGDLSAALARHNPVDRVEPLARAGIPIFHLHGDEDTVVPLETNSALLKQRYEHLGGSMVLRIIPGGGHDMKEHWFQSQELVDFVIRQSWPN